MSINLKGEDAKRFIEQNEKPLTGEQKEHLEKCLEAYEKNPIERGYTNLIVFDKNGYPSCEKHGSLNCVNKERTLWRCSVCHVGVSFEGFDRFQEMFVAIRVVRKLLDLEKVGEKKND